MLVEKYGLVYVGNTSFMCRLGGDHSTAAQLYVLSLFRLCFNVLRYVDC